VVKIWTCRGRAILAINMGKVIWRQMSLQALMLNCYTLRWSTETRLDVVEVNKSYYNQKFAQTCDTAQASQSRRTHVLHTHCASSYSNSTLPSRCNYLLRNLFPCFLFHLTGTKLKNFRIVWKQLTRHLPTRPTGFRRRSTTEAQSTTITQSVLKCTPVLYCRSAAFLPSYLYASDLVGLKVDNRVSPCHVLEQCGSQKQTYVSTKSTAHVNTIGDIAYPLPGPLLACRHGCQKTHM
jgi:hypothetical protein